MSFMLQINNLFLYIQKILKTINMQTVFNEMWYIVEYFIVGIFPSLIVFDWGK